MWRTRSRSALHAEAGHSSRAGFTLVELLIVTLLGSLILAAIYETLLMQERSFRAQSAMASTEQTIRTATEVLAAELREVSATDGGQGDGDLSIAASDSVTFRAYRKAGIVCAQPAGGTSIDVLEPGDAFAAGDSIMIFADGDPTKSTDDHWNKAEVGGVAAPASCTTSWSGYTSHDLSGLSSASLTDVRNGAPVRSFVWMTYGVYQDTTGQWMLGRHEAGQDPLLLVGPLAARDSAGLTLQYLDGNGNTTSDPTQVSRIVIKVLGEERAGPELAGGRFTDTLTTQVFLRNR
jgi:prepilin-type N-terminal cleavage/methylation domain-containing protein